MQRFFRTGFKNTKHFGMYNNYFKKGFGTYKPEWASKHLFNHYRQRSFFKGIIWKVAVPGFLLFGAHHYYLNRVELQSDRVNRLLEDFKSQLQKIIEEHGEDSKEASRVYHMLGVSLASIKLYDEGLQYLHKAIEVGKKVKDESVTYAKTLQDTAHTYMIKGELEKSINLLNESLDIVKKAYGETSKEAGVALTNIGSTYIRLHDSKKAMEYLNKACPILAKAEGEDGEDTMKCLYAMSDAHKRLGEKDAACKILQGLLEKSTKKFGPEHPQTINIKYEVDELTNVKVNTNL